mgnify:CR=1 FL=1
MSIYDIVMNQLDYLYMKEKYMHYHRRTGAENALIEFKKSLDFVPRNE